MIDFRTNISTCAGLKISILSSAFCNVFSDFSRIWNWILQGSCSCTPGTPGPMLSSAFLVASCSTGFLESGTRNNVACCIISKRRDALSFCACHYSEWSILSFSHRLGTIIFSLFVCVGQVNSPWSEFWELQYGNKWKSPFFLPLPSTQLRSFLQQELW